MKHKKDAVEWRVIEETGRRRKTELRVRASSEGSGVVGLLKDKTGLGFAWGRAKEWEISEQSRCVAEAAEFKTKFTRPDKSRNGLIFLSPLQRVSYKEHTHTAQPSDGPSTKSPKNRPG